MTVHFLGTGAAVSDIHRATTMLAFEAEDRYVLVDCGSNVVPRLVESGLNPIEVDAVILTHEHPDHISGFPLLIEQLWLLGREAPIPVYGLADTLRVARTVYEAFDYRGWEGLPSIEWIAVEDGPEPMILDRSPFHIVTSRVTHPVPTIGLRVEAAGRTVAYSCDTSKCPNVVELARGADLLIHEGTGSLPGVHASPEEAAEVAVEAGVSRLVLVHIPLGTTDEDLTSARALVLDTRWAREGGRLVV